MKATCKHVYMSTHRKQFIDMSLNFSKATHSFVRVFNGLERARAFDTYITSTQHTKRLQTNHFRPYLASEFHFENEWKHETQENWYMITAAVVVAAAAIALTRSKQVIVHVRVCASGPLAETNPSIGVINETTTLEFRLYEAAVAVSMPLKFSSLAANSEWMCRHFHRETFFISAIVLHCAGCFVVWREKKAKRRLQKTRRRNKKKTQQKERKTPFLNGNLTHSNQMKTMVVPFSVNILCYFFISSRLLCKWRMQKYSLFSSHGRRRVQEKMPPTDLFVVLMKQRSNKHFFFFFFTRQSNRENARCTTNVLKWNAPRNTNHQQANKQTETHTYTSCEKC